MGYTTEVVMLSFVYLCVGSIASRPNDSSTNLAGKLKIARVPLNKDRADEMKTRNMLVQY